jgi:hypothetical protein
VVSWLPFGANTYLTLIGPIDISTRMRQLRRREQEQYEHIRDVMYCALGVWKPRYWQLPRTATQRTALVFSGVMRWCR